MALKLLILISTFGVPSASASWYSKCVRFFTLAGSFSFDSPGFGPYTDFHFPLSRFAFEDRKVTLDTHQAFALHQAQAANRIYTWAKNGNYSAKKRFWKVAGNRAEKPLFTAMTTPLKSGLDLQKYQQNSPFWALAERLTYISYPADDWNTGRRNLAELGFSKNEISDLESLLIEPYHRLSIQFKTKMKEIAILTVKDRDQKKILGTVLARGENGTLLWVHPMIDATDTLLKDAFERIDGLKKLFQEKGQKEALKEFAAAAYAYYNAVPFVKTSAAIGNRWLAGEFAAIFGEPLPFIDGMDRYAMTLKQEDFILFYSRRLEASLLPKNVEQPSD